MACKKYDLQELQEMRMTWQDVPLEVLPEGQRERYIIHKNAVDMYIDGYSVAEITNATGLAPSNIIRNIDRCTLSNENGEQYGYTALFGNKKLVVEGSFNGNFGKLLTNYPELADFIKGLWYGDKKYTLEKNMNYKTLHARFLKKCQEIGVPDYGYPFNTANQGYVSLCKYVKELDKKNIKKAATRENDDNMQKLMSTGYGTRYTSNPIHPYQVVQMDGHILDIVYNVEIVNDDGTIDKIVATRAWVVAVIDVATRCVLGYSVSQEFNYNQYDVIEAFQNAILPKTRLPLTINGLKYPENGGYPSTAYPELKYAMFDTVMLDNAKAHLAGNTMAKLVDQLQCVVNFGSVATPETRGIVERFFGTLETRGFHRLPATTGSSTRDLKRRSPEKAAIAYDITFDEVVQLLDVLIAEYNTTPHSSLNNLTPLECLRQRVFESGMYPFIADDEMIKTVERLNFITEKRRVCGGNNGKRAFINYEGAEYRGNELSVSGQYIGQTITILIDPRDISTVEAYTANGDYIGVLKARGEYGYKRHSLKTRKNAAKLARERGRQKLEFDTPITAYELALSEKAKKSRREATRADIVRRETGKSEPSKMIEKISGDPSPIVPINSDLEQLMDITDPEEFYKKVWGAD